MSSVFDSYLRGQAEEFFPSHPSNVEDRQRAVLAACPLDPRVAAALEAQNARHVPSPARDANLKKLREGAAAVVTGQQVGLFLGPLFTLFKAASAIRLARELELETGRPVVPIFWLQAEDHDLPEIATSVVAGVEGVACELSLPASSSSRISVAHLTLPDELDALVEELRCALSSRPKAEAHLELLTKAYRSGARWVDAFAELLATLFADEGLILLDPRTPEFAELAAPIHREAILRAKELSERLGERVQGLREAGFSPAVHIRTDSPLCFFHPESAAGERFRLEREGEGFRLVGGESKYSEEELLEILEKEPMRFSTSALLRPILQDWLLPTAAYVGGPGEVAYFAQLSPLYEAFARPMPLIVPRARFRIVEQRTARLLENLGLSAADASLDEDLLLSRLRPTESSALSAQHIQARLVASLESALGELLGELPPSLELEKATKKTRKTVSFAAMKFAGNVEKLRLREDASRVAEVRRLKALLHPQNAPQERVFGYSYFAAGHGDRAFVGKILEAIDPLDFQVKDLFL